MKQISTNSNMKLSVIVSYITLFLSVVGNIVAARFILKYIGSEYYGFYTFSVSLTSYISIISTALSSSYVRFAAIEEHSNEKRLKIVNTIYGKIMIAMSAILLVVALVFVGCLFFGGFSLPQYNEDSRSIIYICVFISLLNVFISIATTVFSLYCNYKKSFLFLRIVSLITTLLTSVFSVVISVISSFSSSLFGPVFLAISALIIQLLSSIAIMVFSFKYKHISFEKISLKSEKNLVRAILSFSSILLISAVVDSINTAADATILGFLSNGDFVTRHHYAHSFSTYLIVASSAISTTFIPRIHELIAKDQNIVIDKDVVRKYYNSIVDLELNNYISAKKIYKEKKYNSGNRKNALSFLKKAKKDYVSKRAFAKKETKKYIQSLKENINKKDNKIELSSLFLKICRTQMLIVFLIVGGFYCAGKEFVTLWLGYDFKDVYYYALVYLGLSTVPLTINISIEIQRALGKHKFRAISYLIIAIINVALSILFVYVFPKQYAIWGCIIGTVFSSLFGIWIIMNVYNDKTIGLPIGKYFLNYIYALLTMVFSCLLTEAILYFFISALNLSQIVLFLIKGSSFAIIYLVINLVINPSFIKSLVPQKFIRIRQFILCFENFHSFLFVKSRNFISKVSCNIEKAKKHKRNTWFAFAISFLIPIVFCSSCLLTNASKNAAIDRFSFNLTNYIEHNNTNYKSSYLELTATNKDEESFDKVKKLYSNLGSSTLFKSQFLTCKETMYFVYKDTSISDCKIVSLSDYSSYRTSRPKYDKTYRLNNYEIFTVFGPQDYRANDYYGFLYITDVFADKIIEENDDVSSYEDIIYTPIEVTIVGNDGEISSHTSLITNIINTELSMYFNKSPSNECFFVSNDLLNTKTKNDYSMVLQSVFYNNTYSAATEIKMIINSFDDSDLSVDFFTYDYDTDLYQNRQDLSKAFFLLYSSNDHIFIGYVFPIILIIVLTSSVVCLFRILFAHCFVLLFIQLAVLIASFSIYSLFNYVYYFWGVILLLVFVSFGCGYLLSRRYLK